MLVGRRHADASEPCLKLPERESTHSKIPFIIPRDFSIGPLMVSPMLSSQKAPERAGGAVIISSTNCVIQHRVDMGAMFTDVVLATPDGRIESLKVPLTPDDDRHGTLEGIAAVLERAGLVHAITVATNAILEHEGARTVLFTTRGVNDVLEMCPQDIPDLYGLQHCKPKPQLPLRTPRSRTPRSGVVCRGEPCTASA